jgi:UDP-N-acetylmuramoyl-tripeptide--D-alanyl-D-alanine ligase
LVHGDNDEGAHMSQAQSNASMNMSLSDCARRLSATLYLPNPTINAVFEGISTDSRRVGSQQLFVALKGEFFDGHDYVPALVSGASGGAVAAVVSRKIDAEIPQIIVGDTMWAYGQLAQYWRSRFSLPTIGITGSNGKTTVKEMLRAILAVHVGDTDAVLATEGNLNNNIGVPQMMLRLQSQHRMAVFEMGMNHLHEIDYLTRLVVPDVALIIMAGTAHIGEVGSREAIAQAKGEIYLGLRHDGVALINIDDAFAAYWRGIVGEDNKRRVVTFGTHYAAMVRGALHHDGLQLTIANVSANIQLAVLGEHNQRNAIAAAAGAHALGVPLATIAVGLANFTGVDGRLRAYQGLQGAIVIDDTYNANPDSMRAAIDVLAATTGEKFLVLGDMGELGEASKKMHAEIGEYARDANIDALFAMGEDAHAYVKACATRGTSSTRATHYRDVDDLVAALTPRLHRGATVLVKGSRFMKMERVIKKIAPQYGQHNKDTH